MSKFSLIARLQHWMDSVPGQTFMNYAYSWGAAVVILGTLFKLTHIPGANLMLFIGMGTEVFVFFISGFDRPFDAKADTELNEEFVSLEEMEALKAAAEAAAARKQVTEVTAKNKQLATQVEDLSGKVAAGSVIKARGISLQAYNKSDKITQNDTMTVSQPATWQNHCGIARILDMDSKPCRHQLCLSRLQFNRLVNARTQVKSRAASRSIGR